MNFKNGYKPLCDSLMIGKSRHGHGIFAIEELKAGIFLGVTHIWCDKRRDWIRTPLGGFINHAEDPNGYINTNIHYHNGDQRELYTIRPIFEGEEICVYYTMQEYFE